MGKVEAKVAFVTGAARGQGRSHALTLASEGADVIAVDICGPIDVRYRASTTDDLEETKRLVEKNGRRCIIQQADVRDLDAMHAAVTAGLDTLGQIDIVVANAGILNTSPVAEMSGEQWRNVVDTNLTGVFNTVRAALPHMIERRTGCIIGISSMAARTPFPNTAHYVAAKMGVVGLIKTIALENGPHGIRANAICPSNVNTEMVMNDAVFGVFRPDLEDPAFSDVEPLMAAMHPLGIAYVEPQDVSNVVLFLASDDARFISGDVLSVSAGSIANTDA